MTLCLVSLCKIFLKNWFIFSVNHTHLKTVFNVPLISSFTILSVNLRL